jgi:hypothetical protein
MEGKMADFVMLFSLIGAVLGIVVVVRMLKELHSVGHGGGKRHFVRNLK